MWWKRCRCFRVMDYPSSLPGLTVAHRHNPTTQRPSPPLLHQALSRSTKIFRLCDFYFGCLCICRRTKCVSIRDARVATKTKNKTKQRLLPHCAQDTLYMTTNTAWFQSTQNTNIKPLRLIVLLVFFTLHGFFVHLLWLFLLALWFV